MQQPKKKQSGASLNPIRALECTAQYIAGCLAGEHPTDYPVNLGGTGKQAMFRLSLSSDRTVRPTLLACPQITDSSLVN